MSRDQGPLSGQSPVSDGGSRPCHKAVWLARIFVALVCFVNLTAAILFVLCPGAHLRAFEVAGSGEGGEALVRGLGVAFLMWQVPFLPVIWRPDRYRVCFGCLLGMQFVGLVGESLMMFGLPSGHVQLRATGWRFIAFDGVGLVGMGLAFAATRSGRSDGSAGRRALADPAEPTAAP